MGGKNQKPARVFTYSDFLAIEFYSLLLLKNNWNWNFSEYFSLIKQQQKTTQ